MSKQSLTELAAQLEPLLALREAGGSGGTGNEFVPIDEARMRALIAEHARLPEVHQPLARGGDGLIINAETQRARVLLAEESGLDFAAGALRIGVPGLLTAGSPSRVVANQHYHEVESSANPGPNRMILESTEAGGLTLEAARINGELNVGESAFFAGGTVRVLHHLGHGFATEEEAILHRHAHVIINPRESDVIVDEQFGVSIHDNLFVGGFIVGRHALQIPSALMICHFDGAYGDISGDVIGHKGQTPVFAEVSEFRFAEPGVFGDDRALDVTASPHLEYLAEGNIGLDEGTICGYFHLTGAPSTAYLWRVTSHVWCRIADGSVQAMWSEDESIVAPFDMERRDWVHVALSREEASSRVALYVDGVLVAERICSPAPNEYARLFVATDGSRKFPGHIDEFATFSKALDDDLIRAIVESEAPIFAETGNYYWRAGAGLVWADAEGLWMQDVDGNAVLGAYGGPAAKSWGGLNLLRGDFLIGNGSAGYVHMSPQTGQVRIKAVVELLPTSIIPGELLPDLPEFPDLGDLAQLDRLPVGFIDGLGDLALQDSVHITDVVGYDPDGGNVPAGNVIGLYDWLKQNTFSSSVWAGLTPGVPGTWLNNSGLITLEKIAETATYKRLRGTQVNSQGLITMDTVLDGNSYARLRSTQVNAGGLVTMDLIEDGGVYARVRATIIKAGYIELGDYAGGALNGWRWNTTELTGYEGGMSFASLSKYGFDLRSYAQDNPLDVKRALTFYNSMGQRGTTSWNARYYSFAQSGFWYSAAVMEANGPTSAGRSRVLVGYNLASGAPQVILGGDEIVLPTSSLMSCGDIAAYGDVSAYRFGTSWSGLSAASGWPNYGSGGWSGLRVRRVGRWVELSGRIRRTTGGYFPDALVATVAYSHRPAYVQALRVTRFKATGGMDVVQLNIQQNGQLRIQVSGSDNDNLEFNGCGFWID